MVLARLYVAPPTFLERPFHEFDQATSSVKDQVCRLDCRLGVLEQSVRQRAFDCVHLYFKGTIKSSIDSRTATEDIISLADIKLLPDFVPRLSESHPVSNIDAFHAEFHFDVPTVIATASGVYRPLPLSTIVTGSASVTQTSALTDHRILRGKCQVSYWVEAQFHSGGRRIGGVREAVQISAPYPALRAYLPVRSPVTVQATPNVLTRYMFQKSPDLSVTLYGFDMLIARHEGTDKPQSALLTAALEMKGSPCAESGTFDSRQSFQCAVEAKWAVGTRFSIVSTAGNARRLKVGESIYIKTTLSTQSTSPVFRPLLPEKGDHTWTEPSFPVAAAQLILSVPRAISQPSYHFDHLSRAYYLDLSFSFLNIPGVPRHHAHINIPITVVSWSAHTDAPPKYQPPKYQVLQNEAVVL
ncbi:uncharacterized protein PV07_03423 [Cladophialophora immunda]|uniref:Arrestin-like N-terminal domain-containing protein n=1 Tax=Cladophialophora immunda TaxID=569365 RepID=A0A0D2CP86_9EURO|nr:uncharacterized protein PV07_03423 [Cladophialophora immunda]KIW31830.1 hypothetical protein PV07_03423 [Cladophialophora immunda]